MTLETLTVNHLDLVFIRTQDEHGRWVTVNAREATDRQFGTWAQSRIAIEGAIDDPWPLEERAAFCDLLWQDGALHILKREVADEAATQAEGA